MAGNNSKGTFNIVGSQVANTFPTPITPKAPATPTITQSSNQDRRLLAGLFKSVKRDRDDIRYRGPSRTGTHNYKADTRVLSVLNQLYDSPVIKSFIAASQRGG